MSELTDRVRKMLSQAQVFVRDTPFEALSRVRQAAQEIDAELAQTTDEQERASLLALQKVVAGRAAKYQQRLDAWLSEAEARANLYNEHERERLQQPMRAKV